MPADLVVANASNTLSALSGSMPGPQSSISAITFPTSHRVLTVSTRRSFGMAVIASMAFWITLTKTSCN